MASAALSTSNGILLPRFKTTADAEAWYFKQMRLINTLDKDMKEFLSALAFSALQDAYR
jgi:hypothetical protein